MKNFKCTRIAATVMTLIVWLFTLNLFAQAPATPKTISGISMGLCSAGIASAAYSIAAVSGATSYTWTATTGASITAGQGTTSATVVFDGTFVAGILSVTASNAFGTSSAKKLVLSSVPDMPKNITGTTSGLYNMSGVAYSIADVAGAETYTWTVPAGASITSGQGTTSATVDFTPAFTAGTLSVTANTSCGSSSVKTLPLNAAPAKPGSISGTTIGLCSAGVSSAMYTISAVPGATSYTWTATPGASITGGQGTVSATVSFDPTFTSGILSVRATNTAGTGSAKTLVLNSLPSTPKKITGATSGLYNLVGVTYSIAPVTGATSYTWTVPSGPIVIIGGQGTTSASLAFGPTFTAGTLSVTANTTCGSSPAQTLVLNAAPAIPGAISGTSVGLCSIGIASAAYSIAAVSGATSYTWTTTSGASITAGQGTTSATLGFDPTFTSGTLSVTATNGAGTSQTKMLTLNSVPAAPKNIIGTTSGLCNMSGVSYVIAAVAGATTYTWTVSSGASIASGQGTRFATVDFGPTFTAGTLSVTANTACGSSPEQTLALDAAPATPKYISGTAAGLCSMVGVTYSIQPVTGATTYTWTVPTGATITGGQGTTSATVDFDPTFIVGTLSVTANTSCGSSPEKILPLKAAPAAPGYIIGSASVSSNQMGVAYSIASVDGATSYVWSVPSGATVASGQGTNSITVNFGSSAGKVSVVASNLCGTSSTRRKTVSVSSYFLMESRDHAEQSALTNPEDQSALITVYPNPTDGSTVSLHISELSETNSVIALALYDMMGNKVYSQNVFCQSNDCNVSLNLKDKQFSKGIYLLNGIINDKQLYQEKIVVQ